jgi:Reverse transcriptase (RNA-dependent DNA polymerase)
MIIVEPPPVIQVFSTIAIVLRPPILPSTKKPRHATMQKSERAMASDLKSIEENDMWILCELLRGRSVIVTKLVFKTERDGNNNFIRYKDRLCAKGYSQIAGLDFEETFESVRAIAAFFMLHILHVDYKTSFLNSDSDFMMFIQQLPGFVSWRFLRHLVIFNKSLYGAPRIWFLFL